MTRHVEDFRLDATVFSDPDRTEQVICNSDQPCGVQPQKTVEIWVRRKEIGSGGSGMVFLEETNCGKKRAVKKVEISGKTSDYMQELQNMVGLPNNKDLFVELIGWFTSESHIYIAMEYLPLKDIDECCKEPLPEPEAKDVGKQLLEGLKMMHDKGIVHRDIKPKNILVVQRSPIWVKIADFGISKRIQEGLETCIGTPLYMAPEMYSGGLTYTKAVDIWSLGCVLSFLLTKCHLFPNNLLLSKYAYCGGAFPEGGLKAQNVSDTGIQFIKGLVVLGPDDRMLVSRALNHPWVRDRPQSAQFLLRNGFDISATDFNANKALLLAAAKDRGEDLVRLLLRMGADVAATTHGGWMALHHAVDKGREAVVRLLLEKGADITATTRGGWTALHHAADKGHEVVVRLLLEKGADITAKNNYGCTALHRAACNGHETVVLLLLEKGADTAMKTALLWTALHLAACQGHEAVVRLLLKKGADVEAKTYTGLTALHWAAGNGHGAVVQSLLERGANARAKCFSGWTALHRAARSGHEKVVQQLTPLTPDS